MEKAEEDSRSQPSDFVVGKKDEWVSGKGDGWKERTDNSESLIFGETTEICGHCTNKRGRLAKKGSEKGTSDYMGVEFYYTGETQLLIVENGRPEWENVQCLLVEVGFLWGISLRDTEYVQELK